MAGRLGVDFGTSNTVIAVWDEARREGVPLHLPDFGKKSTWQRSGADGRVLREEFSVVPSLIHYAVDRRQWIGDQVRARNLIASPRTMRWMKRYIANRSPMRQTFDGRDVSPFSAGSDFVEAVLAAAAAEMNFGADEEVVFTAPVECFEHYEDWLSSVAEAAGMRRFRLLDEPSAAALGYGAHIQSGDVYLVFDFGGGTLDVASILIEESDSAAQGQRCRQLGKAGLALGGSTFDQWVFQWVLAQCGRHDADDDVRAVSLALLGACEQAKEKLSNDNSADVCAMNPDTAAILGAELSRTQFEQILDDHEVFTHIDQTISRALNASRERGYPEDAVKAVLMVGGSSFIPSVQAHVRRKFGRERVKFDRPLDAVARGAAAFAAGVDFYDHIQHDYALRYGSAGAYKFRTLVARGTPYPTSKPVAQVRVNASHDGQRQLGLSIFEVGEQRRPSNAPQVEIVFDFSGAARVTAIKPDDEERRTLFHINENAPTFLPADPVAIKGAACFEVEFSIDANKRLLMTARDLRNERITHRNFPVVKLS